MKNEGNLMFAKACGARSKRSGKPCPQPAMPNGRCRFHGGKTPNGKNSPHFKHGIYTREAITKQRLLRDLLKVMRQSNG